MSSRCASLKRPMAATRQVSLFHREINLCLSLSGLEVLLASAGRISEGQVSPKGIYYGSSMLTVDLDAVGHRVRESCDMVTAQRLAEQLTRDPEAMRQVAELALQEARRIVGRQLVHPTTEVRVQAQGTRILLDVDVEGEVDADGEVEADRQLPPAAGCEGDGSS